MRPWEPGNSSDPLVSIVMPAFKTGDFIGEAIASVRAQTFDSFELIIVDDCSNDGTVDQARKAADGDPRVIIHELPNNGGAGIARNFAIENARGRYIAFLDSDDLWYPHKLEKQLEFMAEKSSPFSFARYDAIDMDRRKIASSPVPDTITHAQLLRCCPVGCLTVIYDRAKVGTVTMPLLRKRQDWATWLRLVKIGGVGHGMDTSLGAYRHRPGSLSRSKLKLIKYNWAMYRQEVGLSVVPATFFLLIHALNYQLRARIPGFSERFGFI